MCSAFVRTRLPFVLPLILLRAPRRKVVLRGPQKSLFYHTVAIRDDNYMLIMMYEQSGKWILRKHHTEIMYIIRPCIIQDLY